MAALMRAQGHSWRMTNEMAIAMVAPIVACFGLVRFGICPLVPILAWLTPSSLYAMAHDAMPLGMLAIVVIRSGLYALATGLPQA
jgi:hypothetical protein